MSAPSAPRRRAWRFGRLAELACVGSLLLRGYAVLARNVKMPVGEIDIVARRGRALAIIEVKARERYETAAESILPRQRARLAHAAQSFLSARPDLGHLEVRFDAMLVGRWRPPRHLVDAWRPEAH
jgi:putative endonuclease